jgi:hypothetical protein
MIRATIQDHITAREIYMWYYKDPSGKLQINIHVVAPLSLGL